jgi:chromosome partitioning protein
VAFRRSARAAERAAQEAAAGEDQGEDEDGTAAGAVDPAEHSSGFETSATTEDAGVAPASADPAHETNPPTYNGHDAADEAGATEPEPEPSVPTVAGESEPSAAEAIESDAELSAADPGPDVVEDEAEANGAADAGADTAGQSPGETDSAEAAPEAAPEAEASEDADFAGGEAVAATDQPPAAVEDPLPDTEPVTTDETAPPVASKDKSKGKGKDKGKPKITSNAPEMPAEVVDAADAVETSGSRPSNYRPPLPRIIAVANQKGGVGKTTTAVNLGATLADLGYRTLVVDLDPQGNASTGLGINIRGLQASMYEVILNDVPIEDCVEASSVKNLFVAPASLDLAGAEIELVPAFSRELRLKQALEEVRDDYDYVLIDCPPSLGLLTINGMAAATEVLVPIQCEYYALEGLGQLLRNVGLVTKNLNPSLEVSTIVLVMYDARTKLSDQVAQEVRDHFGDKVCKIMIPRTIRLSEAPSFGQPISAFDPGSRGAVAYRELAKEVSGGPA